MFTIPGSKSLIEPAETGQRFAGAVPSAWSDWVDLIAAGGLVTAGNSGSRILTLAQLAAAEIKFFHVASRYTGVKFRFMYPATGTITQAAVVMPFGIDTTGLLHPLVNSSDSDSITFAIGNYTADSDGNRYTCPLAADYFDLDGSPVIAVGVKTALTGVGQASVKLQGKFF